MEWSVLESKNKRYKRTQEQNIVIAPEWHDNARALIECSSLDVGQRARFPNRHLAIAHLAETSSSDPILVTHPDHSRSLDATVSIRDTYRFTTLARVKEANFAVAASSDKESSSMIKSKALDSVRVSGEDGLGVVCIGEIPQFHSMVSTRTRKNVGCGWMEHNLSDLPRATVDPRNRVKIVRDPAFGAPSVEFGRVDLPYQQFPVFTATDDDIVIEWTPGSIKDGCSVPAGEGNDIWEFIR